ncbi:ccr4 associated factor [Trapelia coarctata]|nr:ccr4 associated factor [Trapelia coarctata]
MPPLRPPSTLCTRCLARRYLSTTSTSARTLPAQPASSVSPSPPPTGYANLTNRALISLTGHDASKFLQGLTTANIPPLPSAPPNSSPRSLYSAFLNAQGRILSDVFIYPLHSNSSLSNGEEGFLIEVDAAEQENLYKWLKRYKLRAKIALRVMEGGEVGIFGAWDDTATHGNSRGFGCSVSATEGGREGGGVLLFLDSRAPGFGRRVLRAPVSTSGEPGAEELGLGEGSQRVALETYKIRRYLWGIPEGQSELQRETALVQESCVDYMGGVDFRKGCYVGQELVIRTQHTGVVRKRVLPVQLYPHGTERDGGEGLDGGPRYEEGFGREVGDVLREVEAGADIVRVGGKERRVGRWMGGMGNVGLALWRLESLEGDFRLPVEGKEVRMKPFVPGWWAERKGSVGAV